MQPRSVVLFTTTNTKKGGVVGFADLARLVRERVVGGKRIRGVPASHEQHHLRPPRMVVQPA